MATIRHPSVCTADSATTGDEVIDLAATAIRDVLAMAECAPSDLSILVVAASGILAGGDPDAPVIENAFANGLVRQLSWETGLVHALPIVVGLLGEPVLTTGVLTARGLLMAEGLDHVMMLLVNVGEPGAVGAAAFLVSAEEGDGLLIRHVDVIAPRSDDDPSDRPAAGLVEVSVQGADASVQGVLESIRRLIGAAVTLGDRARLIEGSAHGLGQLMLERL